jgi:hypothetical protein
MGVDELIKTSTIVFHSILGTNCLVKPLEFILEPFEGEI